MADSSWLVRTRSYRKASLQSHQLPPTRDQDSWHRPHRSDADQDTGLWETLELTVISLEDESGVVDVLDQGACGRNTSAVRAPMLTAGDHVDLLVRVYGATETDGLGGSLEVFVLWIERAQD